MVTMSKPTTGLTYAERDKLLRSRGFANYKAYQASMLWAGIRLQVLHSQTFKCALCNGAANQVHHSSYSAANLFGKNADGLHAVCGPCHEMVEFDGDKKLTTRQSRAKFQRLLADAARKTDAEPDRTSRPAVGLARKRFYQARHREQGTPYKRKK
jgi:hypothetical protein